ncbi:uncharacterized protein LTR77_003347 [Saxophila tyrrhenica]|uniref:Uncharacterized protein n=1 Tax=Saxophila tyrrhenica TaxID=1690608 RepID=A0AAV9PDF7_9PEZI|nr:hypothetical protein LTR77_003347 [Saxophila tyrrhenica]
MADLNRALSDLAEQLAASGCLASACFVLNIVNIRELSSIGKKLTTLAKEGEKEEKDTKSSEGKEGEDGKKDESSGGKESKNKKEIETAEEENSKDKKEVDTTDTIGNGPTQASSPKAHGPCCSQFCDCIDFALGELKSQVVQKLSNKSWEDSERGTSVVEMELVEKIVTTAVKWAAKELGPGGEA